MLKDILSKFELNVSEKEVLIFLITNGSSPASKIAKLLKIKRPSVYSALDSLIKLGLVFKDSKKSTTFFSCVSAQNIPKILESNAKKKYDELKLATESLSSVLKQLPTKQSMSFAGFQISTIESADAVYRHLKNILHCGNFCAYYDPQLMPKEKLDTVVTEFLINTAKTKPHIREIVTAGSKASDWYVKNIKNPNHKVKLVAPEHALMSDIIIADGEMLISNYELGGELSLRIKEPNLHRSMLSIFNMLWEAL